MCVTLRRRDLSLPEPLSIKYLPISYWEDIKKGKSIMSSKYSTNASQGNEREGKQWERGTTEKEFTEALGISHFREALGRVALLAELSQRLGGLVKKHYSSAENFLQQLPIRE